MADPTYKFLSLFYRIPKHQNDQGELCQNEITNQKQHVQLSPGEHGKFFKDMGRPIRAKARVRQRKMTALQGNCPSQSFILKYIPRRKKKG